MTQNQVESPAWSLKKNIWWIGISEAINRCLPILALSHVTTQLGKESFGKGQFLVNILESGIPWVAFGYTYLGIAKSQASVTSLPPAESGNQQSLQAGSLFLILCSLRIVNAFIVIAVTAMLLWMIPSYHDHLNSFLIFCPFLLLCAFDSTYFFVSSGKSGQFSIATSIAKVVLFGAMLLAIQGPQDTNTYVILLLGVNVIPMAYGLVVLTASENWHKVFAQLRQLGRSGCVLRARELFVASFPFALVLGLLPLYERGDIFFIERLGTLAESGSYQAIVKIQQSAQGVLSALMIPFLSKYIRSSDIKTREVVISKALVTGIALASCAVLGSLFFSQEILKILFRFQDLDSIVTLKTSLLNLFPQAVTLTLGLQVLLFSKNRWKLNVALLVGLLLPFLLHFLLPNLVNSDDHRLKSTSFLFLSCRILTALAIAALASQVLHLKRGVVWAFLSSFALVALGWVCSEALSGELWHNFVLRTVVLGLFLCGVSGAIVLSSRLFDSEVQWLLRKANLFRREPPP